MSDRKSKFGIGVVIGMALGAAAGLFLSPKSGKKNREEVLKRVRSLKRLMDEGELTDRVRDIFGDVSDQGKKLYKQARKDLAGRLEDLSEMDWNKYKEAVMEVVDDLADKTKEPRERLMKLKDELLEEWEEKTEGKKLA